MPANFVHLHLHSEYSVVDSTVRLKPLMGALDAQAMPAVALTDMHNVFAAVKFYSAALKTGVKPIFGAEFRLYDPDTPSQYRHFVLLCQNYTGYLNLSRLLSRAYTEGQHQGEPTIVQAWLTGFTAGLICLAVG